METQISFSNVNLLSSFVAALAAFGIGSIWYSPILFGKSWQTEVKLKDEDMKNANMPVLFVTVYILEFIAAVFLGMFLGPRANVGTGVAMGAIVSVAWIGTALGINSLFTFKTLRLFFIDAGYYFVLFIVMGAIQGAW